jgi:hypothetical protein
MQFAADSDSGSECGYQGLDATPPAKRRLHPVARTKQQAPPPRSSTKRCRYINDEADHSGSGADEADDESDRSQMSHYDHAGDSDDEVEAPFTLRPDLDRDPESTFPVRARIVLRNVDSANADLFFSELTAVAECIAAAAVVEWATVGRSAELPPFVLGFLGQLKVAGFTRRPSDATEFTGLDTDSAATGRVGEVLRLTRAAFTFGVFRIIDFEQCTANDALRAAVSPVATATPLPPTISLFPHNRNKPPLLPQVPLTVSVLTLDPRHDDYLAGMRAAVASAAAAAIRTLHRMSTSGPHAAAIMQLRVAAGHAAQLADSTHGLSGVSLAAILQACHPTILHGILPYEVGAALQPAGNHRRAVAIATRRHLNTQAAALMQSDRLARLAALSASELQDSLDACFLAQQPDSVLELAILRDDAVFTLAHGALRRRQDRRTLANLLPDKEWSVLRLEACHLQAARALAPAARARVEAHVNAFVCTVDDAEVPEEVMAGAYATLLDALATLMVDDEDHGVTDGNLAIRVLCATQTSWYARLAFDTPANRVLATTAATAAWLAARDIRPRSPPAPPSPTAAPIAVPVNPQRTLLAMWDADATPSAPTAAQTAAFLTADLM